MLQHDKCQMRARACLTAVAALAYVDKAPMLRRNNCLQDEAFGRQIPFAFLERVSDEFIAGFASKGKTAAPHSMDRSFGAKLKQHMVRTSVACSS
jgi:hypothetical protein